MTKQQQGIRKLRLAGGDVIDDVILCWLLIGQRTQSSEANAKNGGQQRRVSFSVALLHEPPLLILDEPTVGVDPVLRLSIWEHLLEICTTGSVTVIITTHYIEEARQANKSNLVITNSLISYNELL
uniref:ATPase AAA-type core domain-containing protein n=1 Tax=Strigamia maritima TaxID=126957 RepID=T1JLM1_STRMM